MNKNTNNKYGFIHLYNPKEEGLGSYDFHYMNAYKKNHKINKHKEETNTERYAA
tara:strand:- start:2209 stop:2370 length:162 start_codon:yes stop_codon:yes gene_type:complete